MTLLAKRRSPKIQIEHVTNAETVIVTNYPKTENWHENPKEQKNDAKTH